MNNQYLLKTNKIQYVDNNLQKGFYMIFMFIFTIVSSIIMGYLAYTQKNKGVIIFSWIISVIMFIFSWFYIYFKKEYKRRRIPIPEYGEV